MHLPFDTVLLKSEIPPRKLSATEFLGLPLDRRIGYVLSRQIEFFHDGAIVERRHALASLQQLQAAQAR
jgi:hypothetical protein